MGPTKNIYRIARDAAGLTQMRWAEWIGVSVEAVGQYEAGKLLPSDEVVSRMADASGLNILGAWHLKNKSAIANDLLPEVRIVPVTQAVVNLLHELESFDKNESTSHLLRMASDGTIDGLEKEDYEKILNQLDGIVSAALTLRYSRTEAER